MSDFLERYMSRIGLPYAKEISVSALQAITAHHCDSIVFENLDVILPRPISIENAALDHKLISARRGGWCFEQNGLLQRSLAESGFNVRGLLGRVVISRPAETPALTHQFILVTLEDSHWIIDVGFGSNTPTAPLKLQSDIEQCTSHHTYRLVQHDETWTLELKAVCRWKPLYQFELTHFYPSDFLMSCFFMAHSPSSHFRHQLAMSRHLLNGEQLTLLNYAFKHRSENGLIEERHIKSTEELYDLIQERFGLGVDDKQYGFSESQLHEAMQAIGVKP